MAAASCVGNYPPTFSCEVFPNLAIDPILIRNGHSRILTPSEAEEVKTLKRIIKNELMFLVEVPARGRPATVTVGNAGSKDQDMVRALAHILELWLNRGRTR